MRPEDGMASKESSTFIEQMQSRLRQTAQDYRRSACCVFLMKLLLKTTNPAVASFCCHDCFFLEDSLSYGAGALVPHRKDARSSKVHAPRLASSTELLSGGAGGTVSLRHVAVPCMLLCGVGAVPAAGLSHCQALASEARMQQRHQFSGHWHGKQLEELGHSLSPTVPCLSPFITCRVSCLRDPSNQLPVCRGAFQRAAFAT